MDDDSEAPRRSAREVPPGVTEDHWDEVVEDMAYTAGEYRKEGYQVLEVHPDDVAALAPGDGERWGLDLLVPDDEFETVHEWVDEEGGGFGGFDVYRAEGGGVVYAVVGMRDETTRRVVIFPTYYDPSEAGELLEVAREVGEMRTHLRPRSEDAAVTFVQSEPSLFVE